jgi:hypothetical protein
VRVRDEHAVQVAADKVVEAEAARVAAALAAAAYVNPVVAAVRAVVDTKAIFWKYRFQAGQATTAFVPRTDRIRRCTYQLTTQSSSESE